MSAQLFKLLLLVWLICCPFLARTSSVVSFDTQIEVKEHSSKEHVQVVLIIQNLEELKSTPLFFPYSELKTLDHFEAKLTGSGKSKTMTFYDEDLSERSAFTGDANSLISSYRIKYLTPQVDTRKILFPCTLSILYTYTHRYFNNSFEWFPYFSEDMSHLKSTLSVNFPEHCTLRHKANSCSPAETSEAQSYSWSLTDLSPISSERYTPAQSYPSIEIEILNNGKYSFDSWQSFGDWYNLLNVDRDVLVEKRVPEEIKSLNSLANPYEQIKATYEYVQNNTRYVSIQLGIGGFQSMTAKFVNDQHYGDCKALSTYTKGLLKFLGIDAHYVLVHAGTTPSKIDESFPSNQFNHVLLCIPMQQDSVWLECTSPYNPDGYLGSFTANRQGLFIQEGTSQLVPMPRLKNDIRILKKTDILEAGNCAVSCEITGQGYWGDYFYNRLEESEHTPEEVLNASSFTEIKAFKYSFNDSTYSARISFQGKSQNQWEPLGDQLLFTPDFSFPLTNVLDSNQTRNGAIQLPTKLNSTEKITLSLADEHQVIYTPENKKIQNRFGTYSLSFDVTENQISITRTLHIEDRIHDKSHWPELALFLNTIKQTDEASLMLKTKKT